MHDAPVRLVERFRDLDPIPMASPSASGPLSASGRERLAVDILHHEVVLLVLAADVVQRADVRVVQAEIARLAFEPRACLGGRRRGGAGSTLIATSRASRVSRARRLRPCHPRRGQTELRPGPRRVPALNDIGNSGESLLQAVHDIEIRQQAGIGVHVVFGVA